MWTEYTEQISEDAFYYEQPERTTDVELPPGMGFLLLMIWVTICLVGFAIIFFAKNTFVGIAVIALPTFFGMVIKPTFALCILMLVLPTGAGVGYAEIFSLDRGVGIAVAATFALNLLISRPRLRIRNKALWVIVVYTIWIFLTSLGAPHLGLELRRAYTQFQLLVLVFIAYWTLETNHPKTLIWVLRSYVVGTLGMIGFTYITGAEMTYVEDPTRYGMTFGRAINPNELGDITAMALLAAFYLFARDKQGLWRLIYIVAMLSLPIVILKTGARGALVALAFTMLLPLLSMRQVYRRPALAALLVVFIVLVSVSAAFLVVKGGGLEREVSERLTSVQYAQKSINLRVFLIKKALKAATRPTGTSFYGWEEYSGITTQPHTDFFFLLGIYGIPCAALFALFVIMIMLTVKRIPLGIEKLYARAVLTFLLVAGLSHVRLYTKFYWVFLAVIMASERIGQFYLSQKEFSYELEEEGYLYSENELQGFPT